MQVNIPYCGIAPLPGELWRNWNLDPVLLAVLLAVLAAYAAGARALRGGAGSTGVGRSQQASFYLGWTVLALALVSPLCNLTVALFSARVSQHMLLLLVAAPLLVLGRPAHVIGRLLPATRTRLAGSALHRIHAGLSGLLASPPVVWVFFAVLLWVWHAPGFYAATFESNAVYWAMHVTLLGSALPLWRVLLAHDAAGLLHRLLAGFATAVQMGLLGALITFAPRALYAPHLLTSAPWGYTPLEDQQLGGLIMWVPGCSVFVIALLVAIGRMLSTLEGGAGHPQPGITAAPARPERR